MSHLPYHLRPGWKDRREKLLIAAGILLALIMYGKVMIQSTGTEGGHDTYMHYLFAKYAFKHPEHLLHQWAKPVFTLIAAPFCQFGLTGLIVFNILLAIG